MIDNEKIKSLVVNFCGAFARTDVMTEGVINAWQDLQPDIPVFFSIHGTGSVEARQMLGDRLGMTAYETMDEAIQAAIKAAEAKS
jgi:succinyl-CoA synthetase beta subunit